MDGMMKCRDGAADRSKAHSQVGTIFPSTVPVAGSSSAFLASRSGNTAEITGSIFPLRDQRQDFRQVFEKGLVVLSVQQRDAVEPAAAPSR